MNRDWIKLFQNDADREVMVFAESRKYMYGRMMQIISHLWQEKDPVGALTVGPCAAFVNSLGDYHTLQDRMESAEAEVQQLRKGIELSDSEVIRSVIAERQRQDAKWGKQNHDPVYWLGILGEEFGELCQAINETVFDNGPTERAKGGYVNMRAEAVQIAAVAVAFVEMLDRRYGGVEG